MKMRKAGAGTIEAAELYAARLATDDDSSDCCQLAPRCVLLVFCLLIVAPLLIGYESRTCLAQSSHDPPKTRRRGLDVSEKIDAFYSFEPARSANGELRQRALNITFGLPIRRARFLSDSVIQDELELSNGEVESLKDITNSFNQFNERLRWDRASRAESVKVTAQTKIENFERDLLAFLDSDRPKDKDRERLDQLWRQFVVLGRSNVRSVASPYQRSLELLNLTEEQRANAKTIVDEEIGDLLKFSRVLKDVHECLNSSNREKLSNWESGVLHRKLVVDEATSPFFLYASRASSWNGFARTRRSLRLG